MNRRRFLSLLAVSGAMAAAPSLAWAIDGPFPKGMVTFTFDDGIVSVHRHALPILEGWGQVATAGIVVSRLLSGNADYMNVEQVRELASRGWEIASHSLTHARPIQIPVSYDQELLSGWRVCDQDPGHYQTQYGYERVAGLYQDGTPLVEVQNLAALGVTEGGYWLDRTIAELHVRPPRTGAPSQLNIAAGSYQREMEQSKTMLQELGFAVDTYIAPHNFWTEDVESLSRQSYARVCTGGDAANSPATFNTHAIRRFVVHEDDTVRTLTRIIEDHGLARGGWVVFCFHGVGDKLGWEPYPADKLDQLCAWVAREGVPMVTVREGATAMQAPGRNHTNRKPIAEKGA